MPEAATGTSRAAAKAFVRHYIDVVNYAVRTGETQALLAASADSCESCAAVAARVQEVYSAGGHIKSRGWRLDSLNAVPLQPQDRPMFDLGLSMSPQEVVERAGEQPKHFDGGKMPATFTLVHRSGSWKVLKWERSA